MRVNRCLREFLAFGEIGRLRVLLVNRTSQNSRFPTSSLAFATDGEVSSRSERVKALYLSGFLCHFFSVHYAKLKVHSVHELRRSLY